MCRQPKDHFNAFFDANFDNPLRKHEVAYIYPKNKRDFPINPWNTPDMVAFIKPAAEELFKVPSSGRDEIPGKVPLTSRTPGLSEQNIGLVAQQETEY